MRTGWSDYNRESMLRYCRDLLADLQAGKRTDKYAGIIRIFDAMGVRHGAWYDKILRISNLALRV